jgi:CheY-like chemotaxis protein
MNKPPFRALVVDDEPAVRRLTLLSLVACGFSCDVASDGLEAETLIDQHPYDVVVTDLRMPQRHGHALTVALLKRSSLRPAIVVLTGVAEPRLAEDLLVRGVEAIEFKPVNYKLFSAKVLGIAERRRIEGRSPLTATSSAKNSPAAGVADEDAHPERRLSPEEFKTRLAAAQDVLPISAATLEVVQMTYDAGADADEIAAHLTLDPALTVEILKLANSALLSCASVTSVSGSCRWRLPR